MNNLWNRVYSKMNWWFAMKTLLMWIGMVVPVSGQCFTDNDDEPCGMAVNSETLANGSMYFALSLFKSVTEPSSLPESGNCHISPVSIWIALLLTYMGARENTKAEMQATLHFGSLKQKALLQDYHKQREGIVHNATDTANYTISISDRIFFDNSFQLRQCMVDYLNPDLLKVNLRSASEQSRQLINNWVEENTNGKIVDLLPSGSINSQTAMVIVNAIYLRAAWLSPFQPGATRDEDFFIEPQRPKKVSMMRQRPRSFPYGSSTQLDCTAVELPYSGNEISMVILLPNSNVKDLIAKLSVDNLKDLKSKLTPTVVELMLPKFKLTQAFELTRNLRELGIKDVFNASTADLSGFTGEKNVFVAFVHHKTFIEVNEYGTEAAAATAVGFETTSVVMTNKRFRVDRPFLFLIRHIKYNAILFMGLISDPTVQE